METQRLPEGVELSYTDRAVHLTTNSALMAYLRPVSYTHLRAHET